MISPTPGRVVWFTPHRLADHRRDPKQPLAALVTYVWTDRCVNLFVLGQDSEGGYAQTSVALLQDDDAKPEDGYFASWMPFQKGQAAAQEATAKKGGRKTTGKPETDPTGLPPSGEGQPSDPPTSNGSESTSSES